MHISVSHNLHTQETTRKSFHFFSTKSITSKTFFPTSLTELQRIRNNDHGSGCNAIAGMAGFKPYEINFIALLQMFLKKKHLIYLKYIYI